MYPLHSRPQRPPCLSSFPGGFLLPRLQGHWGHAGHRGCAVGTGSLRCSHQGSGCPFTGHVPLETWPRVVSQLRGENPLSSRPLLCPQTARWAPGVTQSCKELQGRAPWARLCSDQGRLAFPGASSRLWDSECLALSASVVGVEDTGGCVTCHTYLNFL